MRRLVTVELRRLFARRLTLWCFLGALLVGGAGIAGIAQQAKPLSAPEQAQVQRDFAQQHRAWEKHGEQQRTACLREQARERQTHPRANFGCNQMEPKLSDFGKPLVSLREQLPQALQMGSYLLGFVAFLIGAGFMAAEFSTGSMGNWLTFQPRRGRVYGSKLVAAGVGIVPIAAVVLAELAAGTWVVCRVWGSLADPPGTLLTSSLLLGLRVLAVAVVSAVVGAAVGTLVRHTAAVIGIAAGYLVLVEGILAGSLLTGQHQWLLSKNVDAWVQKGTTYFQEVCRADGQGYSCEGIQRQLSFGHGAAYLAAGTAVIALLAAWQFRRRDVS